MNAPGGAPTAPGATPPGSCRTRRGGHRGSESGAPSARGGTSGADGTRGAPGARARSGDRYRHAVCDVGDIGWMNGTTREKAPIFDTKFFTPEIRFDVNYMQSRNHPHGPHDRRLDRGVPLRRIPDRAGELWRRFSLEQRQGAVSVDVGPVRDDHAAQRRQRRGRPVGPPDAYNISRKRTPAITSTSITASTSMRAYSSRTSACSATTTSTTGPTSPRSCHPTRRGSSMACGSSGCRPRS